MFDRIAPVYDAMNRLMTAGLDRRWGRVTVQQAGRPGERMLERARQKEPAIEWLQGDVLALPFADASFDAATVGFGIRNVDDLEAGLRGLRRVLRPGGRLAILEITTPRGVLAPFYRVWFDRIVPLLGRVLPGGAAYTYLPASVRRFPRADELAERLQEHGFTDVRWQTF